MKNTPVFGLSYPEQGNHSRTWEYWQSLAEQTEALLEAKFGRGLIASAYSTANSPQIAAGTEALVHSLPVTLVSGRAYQANYKGNALSGTAGARAFFLVRKTNVSGDNVLDYGNVGMPVINVGFQSGGSGYIKRTGATTAMTLVLSCIATTGAVTILGTPSSPRYFEINDVGPAASYPHAVDVV
jgi:hypothetical protein